MPASWPSRACTPARWAWSTARRRACRGRPNSPMRPPTPPPPKRSSASSRASRCRRAWRTTPDSTAWKSTAPAATWSTISSAPTTCATTNGAPTAPASPRPCCARCGKPARCPSDSITPSTRWTNTATSRPAAAPRSRRCWPACARRAPTSCTSAAAASSSPSHGADCWRSWRARPLRKR
ncbi:Uncharacterised protein [Bordetella pertussis]|nr:Uncharacterised protein [Bordetella pertussis]